MVINDDLNGSYQKIRSIIEAKRVARQNQNDIKKFINQFS
jgi:guanylate kinase